MEGYLVEIKFESRHKRADFLNTFLGRVIAVTRHKQKFFYYYPGILNTIPFIRLGKGVYFSDFSQELMDNLKDKYGDSIRYIKAELDLNKENDFFTAQEYFKKRYHDLEVMNLE